MNRLMTLSLTVLLASAFAHAQTPTGAEAGASAQSQAGVSVQASRSGVRASGNSSTSAGANGSAQSGPANAGLSDGVIMNAKLDSSVDAKKNKPGDRIEAQTVNDVKQDGQVVIPKGSKLIGHVTQAQAREKDQSQSALGVAFDQAQLRNGQTVPMHAAIQALALSQSAAQTSMANSFAGEDTLTAGSGPVSAGGSGGGLIGGGAGLATGTVMNTAGGVVDTAGTAGAASGSTLNSSASAASRSTRAVGGLNAGGALASNSQGVFGLQGMALDATASTATQSSMIVSTTRNVHLDTGTQMLLRVQSQNQ